MKQQIKTLTAQNDFNIRNVCDLNFFDIVSDYNTFHNHDFYEFFLVVKGKGVHHLNGIKTPLFRNVFVALRPSDVHSFSVVENEELRILNLAFCKEIALPFITLFETGCPDTDDCCEKQAREDIFPSHITLSDSQANEIVEQYHNLHIKSHPDSPDVLLLKSFFSYLFSIAIMNNGRERQEGNAFPDWLRLSIVGLAEKDNCALGLSYLIENTGMNQSYLCRIFRRYMNCTPTEYINSLRLKTACNLLTYTPRSIVDICFECGFSSVSHFNHLFKKCFGISPTEYRGRSL